MEVRVGSWLEWCIVGVEVRVMMVLMVLMWVIMEASSSPPSSLPPRPRRHPPPLSWSPLVSTAVMLVVVGVTIAVGGAVQGVAAGAALGVLVEAALVVLVPGAMRAGRAHARGRRLEGEGQESRTMRRRRRW